MTARIPAVMPAKAGIQVRPALSTKEITWIPALAGMTVEGLPTFSSDF
jgi:hypothetical protein